MGFSRADGLPVAVVPSKQVNVSKPPAGGRTAGDAAGSYDRACPLKLGHVGRRVASIGHLPWRRKLVSVFAATAALGDSLPEALAKAYQSNPQLNCRTGRGRRATDEKRPARPWAGYRPQIIASLSGGLTGGAQHLLPDNTIQSATLKTMGPSGGDGDADAVSHGFKDRKQRARGGNCRCSSGSRGHCAMSVQGVLLDAVTRL